MKCTALMTLSLSVFLLTSCGGNGKTEGETGSKEIKAASPGGRLNGAWEIKRVEGSMADMNMGTVYEFDGNKLTFGKGGFKNPGTTVVTDSTFSFQADGNEFVFMYDYHFKGDTLVVSLQKSNQTFYMVKQ